jgi:hypothetical protein
MIILLIGVRLMMLLVYSVRNWNLLAIYFFSVVLLE